MEAPQASRITEYLMENESATRLITLAGAYIMENNRKNPDYRIVYIAKKSYLDDYHALRRHF
jgi:hypothetical protein